VCANEGVLGKASSSIVCPEALISHRTSVAVPVTSSLTIFQGNCSHVLMLGQVAVTRAHDLRASIGDVGPLHGDMSYMARTAGMLVCLL
jgi:hypothetical protein